MREIVAVVAAYPDAADVAGVADVAAAKELAIAATMVIESSGTICTYFLIAFDNHV